MAGDRYSDDPRRKTSSRDFAIARNSSSHREVSHPPVAIDPVEEAWKLALANNLAEAYATLRDLECACPERLDVPLRLYWLLSVQPELDSEHSRHHWLSLALVRSRLTGPASELYSRELECYPEATLAGPYERLLACDASGASLLSLAGQRLMVAGQQCAWSALDRDLSLLAARLERLEETDWLSHLAAVMGHVCFEPTLPVHERCNQLLAPLKSLELGHSWAFDQIENQQELARVWRAATAMPAAVRDVVRESWSAPGQNWKKSLGRAALWVINDPAQALEQFDRASRDPQCHQVLTAYQRLLAEVEPSRETPYPAGLIRGLVREFLHNHRASHYVALRAELIRFLVREVIDPDEVIGACIVDSALGPRALTEHIRTDVVLRQVWLTAYATS